MKIYEYAANRAYSVEKMNQLNLSDEFKEFKFKQEQRHEESLKKFEKTKIGSMVATMIGTLGLAGCIVGGALATPVLVAGTVAAYALGGVGVAAKIGEKLKENKHLKEYGDHEIFLKDIDKKSQNKGEEFYSDFVKRMASKPNLSNALSEVSKKFKEKKELLLSEQVTIESPNKEEKRNRTSRMKR